MNDKKKRASARSIAIGLIPPATVMLTNGRTIQGGLLILLAMGLMAYAEKFTTELPSGVDEETFTQLAELGADGIKQLLDSIDEKK